jgi:hypothetical protein
MSPCVSSKAWYGIHYPTFCFLVRQLWHAALLLGTVLAAPVSIDLGWTMVSPHP